MVATVAGPSKLEVRVFVAAPSNTLVITPQVTRKRVQYLPEKAFITIPDFPNFSERLNSCYSTHPSSLWTGRHAWVYTPELSRLLLNSQGYCWTLIVIAELSRLLLDSQGYCWALTIIAQLSRLLLNSQGYCWTLTVIAQLSRLLLNSQGLQILVTVYSLQISMRVMTAKWSLSRIWERAPRVVETSSCAWGREG